VKTATCHPSRLRHHARHGALLFFLLGAVAHFGAAQETPNPSTRELRRPDWSKFTLPASASEKTARSVAARPALPPLPPGVEALEFSEFFKTPVGPRGLELTGRLKSLDGKRVRIFGYMVHEDLTPCNAEPGGHVTTRGHHPIPAWLTATVTGRMLFAPEPCMISMSHYGLCDDLPPQTLFVTVPTKYGQLVSYVPGPMLLTGILSVGNKTEVDGRISIARLALDPPPPSTEQVSYSTTATHTPPTQKNHP
jgi:hypothetical protein